MFTCQPFSSQEDEVDFKVLSAKSRRRQVRAAIGAFHSLKLKALMVSMLTMEGVVYRTQNSLNLFEFVLWNLPKIYGFPNFCCRKKNPPIARATFCETSFRRRMKSI